MQKIKTLRETAEYDTIIAKYIPGTLELMFQGMLEDINTKEQPAHISSKDMEHLEFQIMLTYNYFFPMIAVNIFFAFLIKEISITCYGNDKQLMLTFLPYEIYQYSDTMLKYLPGKSLKRLQKTLSYSNRAVVYNKTTIDRRTKNIKELSWMSHGVMRF